MKCAHLSKRQDQTQKYDSSVKKLEKLYAAFAPSPPFLSSFFLFCHEHIVKPCSFQNYMPGTDKIQRATGGNVASPVKELFLKYCGDTEERCRAGNLSQQEVHRVAKNQLSPGPLLER